MILKLDGQGPKYRQLYRSLKTEILGGNLKPNQKLPSSREIAQDLSLSRNIVMLAFEQLQAEGYISSQIGSGSFVANIEAFSEIALKHSKQSITGVEAGSRDSDAEMKPTLSEYTARALRYAPRNIAPVLDKSCHSNQDKLAAEEAFSTLPSINFQYSETKPDPLTVRLWRKILNKHADKWSSEKADVAGYWPLRKSIADYVNRNRGIRCAPEQIFVVNGTQQALDLTARMLINPGEAVAIEDPAYSGAKAVFKAQGGIMAPIRVDKHGFDPKAWLPTRNRLAFAYCTPSHQFPTGAKMPVQRRLELLQWAREQDTYIIEDDYDSEFRYEGGAIEAVHALDSDNRVIYIGSFSKHLFPALRLGFIVAPPMLIKPLYATKYLADRHTALLSQLVLHEFIEEGHFERHLRRMRMQNAVKRDHLLKTVREMLGAEVTVTGAHSGVHICVWFTKIPCHLAKTFDKYLQKNNIELKFIADLSELPAQSVAALLGYETLSEQEITIGITELARLYHQFTARH